MLPWLRDFTDLPLGVYPNLGYYTESGWAFDHRIGGDEFAELAAAWRDDGADIIGGCCGVRPHAHRRGQDAPRRHAAPAAQARQRRRRLDR